MMKKEILACLCAIFTGSLPVFAQKADNADAAATADGKSDRNVMLNADDNVGPREINIGLPSSVGGTTILHNGVPVVYWAWPESPTTSWRQDGTVSRSALLNITESAIDAGNIGYTMATYDNTGTDNFRGGGSLNSNHFGLLRGTINLSGPLGKNGWKYSLGAYASFDPGTFDPEGYTRYYADKSQLYKAGLTKDYQSAFGKGSFTAFYRYATVNQLSSFAAPYYYGKGGKVSEIDGFRIGNDSYFINHQMITMRDAFTGEYKEVDPMDDYMASSHSADIQWKHQFNNGLNLDFRTTFRRSKVGKWSPAMTGVASANGNYTYEDGTPYNGEYVQNVMVLATRRSPINHSMSTLELWKQSGKHRWTVGLNEWHYHIDRYATESVSYTQEVAPNPQALIPVGAAPGEYVNGMTGFNSVMEYHDGSQNKFALILKDKWDILPTLTVNLGARLEYQRLRGHYMKLEDRVDGLNGPKSRIKDDLFNKSFTADVLWKITRRFGATAEAMYAEVGGHLGNYNTGAANSKVSKSQVPMVNVGLFYNHELINIVSKFTYISRTDYSANSSFTHPETGLIARAKVNYDVNALSQSTDMILKPWKWFNLHFLLTLQNPQYKQYAGKLNFTDNSTRDFDFSGNTVTGISKVLMEIDPSFMYKGFRLWASARYYSKQYANLSNTLTFESHWETFAGISYTLNKHLAFSVNAVNLLNQRGASGSISGTDLMTAEEAASKEGTVMSGSYIRPFTVEFGLKYNF